MIQPYISDLAIYLPESEIPNSVIEEKIKVDHLPFQAGILKKIFGSETRYFADLNTQVSDLAASAGEILLQRNSKKVDLLIFASASSDLIEPATANIVQQKLNLNCSAMDIKNACNSFVTAMEVACAFVKTGTYQNILIVNGEKLSEVINYFPRDSAHLMDCISGYSLGDAGAAVLISNEKGSEIHFQRSLSWGEHWELCTVSGGGSRFFRDMDKYYFEGKTSELKNLFIEKALPFANKCIEESDWSKEEIDCMVTHQVSKSSTDLIASSLGIDREKCINVFSLYGNTAAASIPLSILYAVNNGKLKKGDKLLIVGLAAGISASVQLVRW